MNYRFWQRKAILNSCSRFIAFIKLVICTWQASRSLKLFWEKQLQWNNNFKAIKKQCGRHIMIIDVMNHRRDEVPFQILCVSEKKQIKLSTRKQFCFPSGKVIETLLAFRKSNFRSGTTIRSVRNILDSGAIFISFYCKSAETFWKLGYYSSDRKEKKWQQQKVVKYSFFGRRSLTKHNT